MNQDGKNDRMSGPGRTLRVVAADDSSVMRGVLRTVFKLHNEDAGRTLPKIELCEVVKDGVEALESVQRLRPDVLILDLEMPRMNGLDVLERLREQRSMLPVIMCSAYTERGARATLDALSRGAKDYVTKPGQQKDFASALDSLLEQLVPRIVELARQRDADPAGVVAHQRLSSGSAARVEVVVIGVSTGGPSALETMLPLLPREFPVPVLIVQHMPKLFTGALAERLGRLCPLPVAEAHHGALLRPGTVWLAPGDAHMEVALTGPGAREKMVWLHQQAPLNHCKPSVDYLFRSAAWLHGAGTLALIMTGMGSDGLEGARAVKAAGGGVLAQDEASSAVWGMPGRVVREGLADATYPLSQLARALVQRVQSGRLARSLRESEPGLSVAREREVLHGHV